MEPATLTLAETAAVFGVAKQTAWHWTRYGKPIGANQSAFLVATLRPNGKQGELSVTLDDVVDFADRAGLEPDYEALPVLTQYRLLLGAFADPARAAEAKALLAETWISESQVAKLAGLHRALLWKRRAQQRLRVAPDAIRPAEGIRGGVEYRLLDVLIALRGGGVTAELVAEEA